MNDKSQIDIKFLIKDRYVHFVSYRQGFFIYAVSAGDKRYTFPIPLEDIGTATMNRTDKAITFMRWIRKAIDDKTLIEANE